MDKDFDLGFDGIFEDYHPTRIDEKTFVTLAEAYIKDYGYLNELDNTTRALADKYNVEKDFLGIPYFGGNLFSVVSDLLGDDFSYWHYDCEQNFEEFNKRITFPDGTHPTVHSLNDLWAFSAVEAEVQDNVKRSNNGTK